MVNLARIYSFFSRKIVLGCLSILAIISACLSLLLEAKFYSSASMVAMADSALTLFFTNAITSILMLVLGTTFIYKGLGVKINGLLKGLYISIGLVLIIVTSHFITLLVMILLVFLAITLIVKIFLELF